MISLKIIDVEHDDRKNSLFNIFLLINLLLSAYFSAVHVQCSVYMLDWNKMFLLEGPNPYQSRLLTFLIGKPILSLIGFKPINFKILFVLYDFISSVIAITFITKTIAIFYKKLPALICGSMLFWWQMYFTFVISMHHNYYLPYDLVSVCLISVALYLILANKNVYLIAGLSAIGMLNRETAIIIPAFYLAYNWENRTADVIIKSIILFAICLTIKAIISVNIANPSDSFLIWEKPGYLRLFYNFSFLSLEKWQPLTLNAFAVFGFLWILFALDGRIPQKLSRLYYPFIPYFIGMMFVGNLSEIRIFAEFIPIVTLTLLAKFSKDLGFTMATTAT